MRRDPPQSPLPSRSWAIPLIAALLFLHAPIQAAAAAIKIVAFGTSNIYGNGVARGDDFPSKLEHALQTHGYDVEVSNAGINGDTSEGMLARVRTAVPDGTQIAIVEPGYNDQKGSRLIGGRTIKPAQTRKNFDAILDNLRSRHIEVLLIGRREVDLGSVARAHHALFYEEFRAGAGRNPAYLTVTQDHLNAAGYDIVVARVLPLVESLIARVTGQ
jgi:acyl-CoA thioesterase-1